jgi:hypothetical protein
MLVTSSRPCRVFWKMRQLFIEMSKHTDFLRVSTLLMKSTPRLNKDQYQVEGGFPSTQRYYRRFVLLIIYLVATCFGRTTIFR